MASTRMNRENEFVEVALASARDVIGPPLSIERGKSLLYQVTVNNRLKMTVNPRDPKRGQSAFQTDLCVFETVESEDGDSVKIPRVVMEFKWGLSTHDVLTYSAKATRHKQVYPYLRYGLVIGKARVLPGRFFTHNSGMDFAVAAASFGHSRLHQMLAELLEKEVAASRRLEQITFGDAKAHLFRSEVEVRTRGERVV